MNQTGWGEFVNGFARFVAHGLRNRLTPAFTYVRMLKESPDMAPERRRMMIELADRSLDEALKLCRAVEQVSHAKAGEVRAVDLAAWLGALAGRHGVALEGLAVTGVKTVELDTGLWETALGGLLENVREHGNARAGILAEPVGDGQLRVAIVDQGPGMGAMDVERVLEPTRRREGSPGAGMGLSRVTWAVLQLGGSLQLEAMEPGGIRATVTGRLGTIGA